MATRPIPHLLTRSTLVLLLVSSTALDVPAQMRLATAHRSTPSISIVEVVLASWDHMESRPREHRLDAPGTIPLDSVSTRDDSTAIATPPELGPLSTPCPVGDTADTGVRLQLDVSTAVTEATVDGRTLSADLSIRNHQHPEACGWRRQRTLLSVKPSYDEKKKDDAAAVINRVYMGHLQHLLYLPGNRFYASANARYLHNRSLGVYLQQTYSVVLGTEIETSIASMEFNAGPAFVGQNFTGTDPSLGFFAAALAELITFSLDFIVPGAELTENVRVTLPFEERDAWQISGLAALRLPLSPRFDVTLTAFDDYLANAPAGFKKNYFTSSAGVSIRLGRLQ